MVRDPLYGFIGLSETEVKIVDTKPFRRLHRIKQLAHTHLVYPTAHHTRFEHSLGVMHVAGRMCDELGLAPENKRLARLAGLLHDIGHGPYSHLFEHVLKRINPEQKSIHESIGQKIIQEDTGVRTALGDDAGTVADVLSRKGNVSGILSDIVSSNLDADKLDYLRRDSYFLGVTYGVFDLERILHTLTLTRDDSTLAIDVRGMDALENYRLARYLMHAQVYKHHTRMAADQMFLRAMDIAIHDEGVIDKDLFDMNQDGFLGFYAGLDDNTICNMIMNSDKAKISKEILEDIRERRLLKRACQFGKLNVKNPVTVRKFSNKEQNELDDIAVKVAGNLGIPSHQIIFHKVSVSMTMYDYEDIVVVGRGMSMSMASNSPMSKRDDIDTFYVFGPPDTDTLERIAQEVSNTMSIGLEDIRGFK